MDKVKIAVVGVGSISDCHIQAYKKNSNAEIVAFCDINREVLLKKGQLYGVENLFNNIDEMLSSDVKIDAVSICVPNYVHAELAIKALEKHKDVLCEKPMAISLQEAQKMQEAATRNGCHLQIGFVRRFGKDCLTAQELIKNSRLGNIYYAKACYIRRNGNPCGWFANKSLSGGGPLIDLGVHVIDLVRYLVGNPKVTSVYGQTFKKLGNRSNIKDSKGYLSVNASNDICDVEDMAVALIKFDNGLVLNLETSFSLNTSKDESYIQLFGDKGGIKLDNELILSTELDNYLVDTKLSGNNGFDFFEAFDREINHFIDVVKDNKKMIAPACDGVELMRILDAIYLSAKENREIVLDTKGDCDGAK